MRNITYIYHYTCDRCGTTEDFEADHHFAKPDAWYEISGKKQGTVRPMRDKHLCQDCYDFVFGSNGVAWEFEEDDDDPLTVGEALGELKIGDLSSVDLSDYDLSRWSGIVDVKKGEPTTYTVTFKATVDDDDDFSIGLTD